MILQWQGGKSRTGEGFVVHKDIVNTVIACRPVSSNLITICLSASPLNITIIQTYTSLSRTMIMMRLKTPITICWKSCTGPLKKTSLLCQAIGTPKYQELERHLWALLQLRDKRERSKASEICLLQRCCAGEYTWQTQSIQKMDMTQRKWRIP